MARTNLSGQEIQELINLLQTSSKSNCPTCQFIHSKKCPDTPTDDCYMPQKEIDITLDLICLTVAREFGVTVEGIKSDNRHTPFSDVRRIIAVLILKFTGNNLVQTASIMNKNHATIIHYRKKHEDLLKTDVFYREKFERLRNFFEIVG